MPLDEVRIAFGADATPRMTLTIEEAARMLGIGRNSAYEACKRGEIPSIKIGRLLRVPRIPFERMLAGQ